MAIDIENIMSEIRSDIQQKGLNSSMLSFADVPCDANPTDTSSVFDPGTLHNNVLFVGNQYELQPYRPLKGNPISVFFKKIFRKLIKFYIEPLAQEQTYFNANAAQALQEVELYISENQNTNTADLASQLADLELQQRNNRIQIELLNKQIKQLQTLLNQKDGVQ